MTLNQYLEDNEITLTAFALKISTTSMAVGRYRSGRVPRPEVMRRILKATGGQVTPNDFYDLPAVPSRRRKTA